MKTPKTQHHTPQQEKKSQKMTTPTKSNVDDDYDFVDATDLNDAYIQEQEDIAGYRRTVTASICFYGVILPILAMWQCSGWNEGSMEVESCFIDTSVTRGFANFLYGIVLVSAFAGCVPCCIYGCLLFALDRCLVNALCCYRGCYQSQGQRNARFHEVSVQELV